MKRLWKWILSGVAASCLSGGAWAQDRVVIDAPRGGPIATALPGQSCAGGNCGVTGCNDFACDGGGRGGVIAGASLYYLQPHFRNNPAFATTTSNAAGTAFATSTTDFNWDYEPGVAFYLGFIGDQGLGVRARYFYFDQNPDSVGFSLPAPAAGAIPTVTIAAPDIVGLGVGGLFAPGILAGGLNAGTDVGVFDSNLRINSWDLEGIYALDTNARILLSAGGRYLNLSQDYRASIVNVANIGGVNVTENQALIVGQNFNGAGPTASLQASIPIGQSGLAAFGMARGSVLAGSSRRNENFALAVNDPNGVLTQSFAAGVNDRQDVILSIAEFELGLEYGANFGGNYGFVRSAIVSQTYFDAGSASQRNGDLGLYGIQFTAGLNY